MVTNRYISDDKGNWYYFGKDKALHGFQTQDGNLHYFHNSGQQVKGGSLRDNDIYYLDKANGNPVTNQLLIEITLVLLRI